MTKQEYIKSRCNACGLCNADEYCQYCSCPDTLEISEAWDASRKQAIDDAWQWINEGNTFAALKESFYKAMEGTK